MLTRYGPLRDVRVRNVKLNMTYGPQTVTAIIDTFLFLNDSIGFSR